MTRTSVRKTCRLAVGMVIGLAAVAQVRAGDFGVARVSDRPRAVVRAQSPALEPAPTAELEPVPTLEASTLDASSSEVPTLELIDCEAPTMPIDYGCNSNGVCNSGDGLVPGLHYSVSCPEHGGVYDSGCPRCRYFAGFGQGDWTLDPHGNPVWCGPSGTSIGDKFCKAFQNMGDRFCKGLSRFDKCLAGRHGTGGPGQPVFGHYRIVYPVDPWYFDSRDGQVYAAAEYGGPVSVPLAPIVTQQYNYGWGVPSSRITPISRPLPLGGQP